MINQYTPIDENDCDLFFEYEYNRTIEVNQTSKELTVNFSLPINMNKDTKYIYYINVYKKENISDISNIDSLYANNSLVWVQGNITEKGNETILINFQNQILNYMFML